MSLTRRAQKRVQPLCFLSWFGILLDARISLVPVVSNDMRLLPADCLTKGWPLSSPPNKGSVVALAPLLLTERYNTIIAVLASVGLRD